MSAAANGMDDLDAVAGLDHMMVKPAARYNLVIDFQRKPSSAEPQCLQQPGRTGLLGDFAPVTVEYDIHSNHGAV
jgi:hypothetical protein